MRRVGAFVAERSLIETLVALALGFALASLTFELARTFLAAAGTDYSVAVHGHPFDFSRALAWLVELVLFLALVGVALRVLDLAAGDEAELRDCPHCLAAIPAAARVCEFCTRDVEPAAAHAPGA